MTEQEIRLRCMELAIEQYRREQSTEPFKEHVAKLATWFYDWTVNVLIPATAPAKERSGKKDKSPEIFA